MILVWLRTGSDLVDINRYESHTGKNYFYRDDIKKRNRQIVEKFCKRKAVKAVKDGP